MTTTLTAVPTTTTTVAHLDARVGLDELRRCVRQLGERLAELPLTDPRWEGLGAPVSAVADLVRRSVGRNVVEGSGDLAPIVRLRDLAVAGRALLGSDATLVDAVAARDARETSDRITMALA